MRISPLLNRRRPDTTCRARVAYRRSLELLTPDELVLKYEPSDLAAVRAGTSSSPTRYDRTTALGTGWSDADGRGPRAAGHGARTADGSRDRGHGEQERRWQLRVLTAEDEREHNPVRRVIHNVHRIKLPLPRTPTPFYRHLFLTARGALTITRICPNLPPGEGPNLPLPTSIEMTPDASAVVTFHRIHWKGSPEYAGQVFADK